MAWERYSIFYVIFKSIVISITVAWIGVEEDCRKWTTVTAAGVLLAQVVAVLSIGLPPYRLVSPRTSTRVALAYALLLTLLYVANVWLCVWIAVDDLDGCPLLRPMLSTVHGGSFLLGVASAVIATVLWYLGPPSHDRTDKSFRKRAVCVDFLKPEDFGQGDLATTISKAGATVGMCHCPGRFDRLESDLECIKVAVASELSSRGVSPSATSPPAPIVAVTLMEDDEFSVMGLPDYDTRLKDAGIECLRYPVRDKWFPKADIGNLALALVERLKNGQHLIIHCYGGKGRTGTVAAVLLLMIWQMDSSVDCQLNRAIQTIRRRRPGLLKNPVQQMYIQDILDNGLFKILRDDSSRDPMELHIERDGFIPPAYAPA